MRKGLIATAAVLAAVVIWIASAVPPRAAVSSGRGDRSLEARTLRGAFHVHSARSDGTRSKSAIAGAASRAGLQFVIFTEHGDGNAPQDAPAYIEGVLCIDGVEISTDGGHYVALGVGTAPYRLGGSASSVVEDVRRLGGFGVAAHPDSAKAALAWTDWSLKVDGLEWLNADTEWRDESKIQLLRSIGAYFVRPAPALASLVDGSGAMLARWDAIAAQRRIVGLAAHDAHGGPGGTAEGRLIPIPGIPSYESSFRSFAIRVIVEAPPTGDAALDAAELVRSLRAGRTFAAVDGVASPAWLDFHGERQGSRIEMGEEATAGPVTFVVRSSLPPRGSLVLLRNGTEMARSSDGAITVSGSTGGAYRAEVQMPGRAPGFRWLVGNPIYVGLPASSQPAAPDAEVVRSLREGEWRIEKDPGSVATLREEGGAAIEYQLRSGAEVSQYVAMALPLPQPGTEFDAITLELSARQPMRVSVQLRFDQLGGLRFGTSVYVASNPRSVIIPIRDLKPLGHSTPLPSSSASASSILLVVDLTNATPASAGRFRVHGLALARLR
jgi:hypothetical protein